MIPSYYENAPKMFIKRSQHISKHVATFLENNPKVALKYYQHVSKKIPKSFKQWQTYHMKWSKNDPKWSQYDFKMVHKYLYHVPKIPLKASNEAFGRRPNKCLNEEAPNRARAQLFFYKYQWYKKIIQKIQKCEWNAKNTNNTKKLWIICGP